ncbi:MAG: MBL fold metallo-hydrolase [Myxococcaceae bacterium]|nr:MBL fold metallo-hydrolase [Myxococcaceae bacterium]MCI0670304.1 MBL fold metallo-hydrolase [Myxococcaceae bacterium]
MPQGIRYAGYPSAFVYPEVPTAGTSPKPIKHLLWGDWMRLLGEEQGDYLKVQARGGTGWIRKDLVESRPLLEVVFVDIGQGDGCIVSVPKADGAGHRHLLVDAGEQDNMLRFLRWRFDLEQRAQEFEAAIITHPDQDHYLGFKDILEHPNVKVRALFHNGIVERKDGLGEVTNAGRKFVRVVSSHEELEALLGDEAEVGGKRYAGVLRRALERGAKTANLSTAKGYVPGFGEDQPVSLQVLGPVVQTVGSRNLLPWFEDAGKTKNGHSVVLRLKYGGVSVLLGGDLNTPAENHLLRHHTGGMAPDESGFLERARSVFRSDVAKACHHGSADFSSLFLRAVHPLATVISSGDENPHAHPRADALGAIGVSSRGERPLVFSTELARSAPEQLKHPNVLRQRRNELLAEYDEAETAEARARVQRKLEALLDMDRSISVYGAINLRTDGKRVVMAYRLERERNGSRWDLYRLEPGAGGELEYRSNHA